MTLAVKIVTVSDSVAAGTSTDGSGTALARRLTEAGFTVVHSVVVADGVATVARSIKDLASDFTGLILTTGGTGFGPRDLTPEGTAEVIERAAPGLAETIRRSSPLGGLSRGIAGTVGSSLVVNVPGSPTGAVESIEAILDVLPHALALLAGDRHPHPTQPRPSHPEPAGPSVQPAGPSVQPAGPLTHVDERGHAHMVDISGKQPTRRLARASCRVLLSSNFTNSLAPGVDPADVLGDARIAGIQAAKSTASLVPLCHPLALSAVSIDLDVDGTTVTIASTTETVDRTGVEMESLTACVAAALTVVCACKDSDPPPVVDGLVVEEKLGGRSGHWRHRS